MKKLENVKYKSSYELILFFNDGMRLLVDFTPFLKGNLGEMLKDKNYFRQFSIDGSGGLTWPNGFDFCANFLFEIGKTIPTDVDIAA